MIDWLVVMMLMAMKTRTRYDGSERPVNIVLGLNEAA